MLQTPAERLKHPREIYFAEPSSHSATAAHLGLREGTIRVVGMTARQRIIAGFAVAVAFGALAVAAIYSADTGPADPVFSGGVVDGGGDRPDDPNEVGVELEIDPIQRWFPLAGEGSACSEVVGVDLIPGYTALLTINGVKIPIEETNVYSDIDSKTLSAGGSQGQVTWGPEPDCPFGQILRPTANEVVACIYRIGDGPANCRTLRRPDTFDF